MKKLMMVFSLFGMLMPTVAFAEDHSIDNSGDPVPLTMVSEEFNGIEIYRKYQDKEGGQFHHYIEVPADLLDNINNSDEPLLEAKKSLVSLYTKLGLKERLAEVNGEYAADFGYIDLTVPKKYSDKFKNDKKEASEFAKREKKEWDNLSDEERERAYDRTEGIYQDYSEMKLGTLVTQEDLEEYYKAMEADSLEPDAKKDKSTTENSSMIKTVGIALMILFMIAAVVFVLLKRR